MCPQADSILNPDRTRDDAASGAEKLQSLGRRLVSHFYKVAKTVGMFGFSNVITKEAVITFMETSTNLLRHHDEVLLQTASDCLFVNETRLKINIEGFSSFKFLIEELKRRGIGGLSFRRGLSEADLCEFLRLFVQFDEEEEEAYEHIDEGLAAAGIRAIALEEVRELAEEATRAEVSEGHREVSINTYFKSIFVAKQFMDSSRGVRPTNLRKANRVVHSIVDLVAEDERTLLALTQIKNYDDCLFTHSANVCVLAVALGQNIGLDKVLLGDLGLAAILHDLGLIGNHTDAEPGAADHHPALGVRKILAGQGVSRDSIRCALATLEHHLREDGSGFPELDPGHECSLLGRIIAITDFYDTITTPSEGGSPTFSPEEALRLMAHEGREVFPRSLVKAFVNTIGTYPLGTAVKLTTGEVGIVHSRSSSLGDLSRPKVKIIQNADGESVPHEVVDLIEVDPRTGVHTRGIVAAIPAYAFFEDFQSFTEAL
jgi:HD-GYP domain-containing protein (c-di-GMP phosphodiesterase class II)